MKIFWDTSKTARHRTRKTFLNLLLMLLISAGTLFVATLLMALWERILPYPHSPWNPQFHSWWINSKYGEALGMRHISSLEPPNPISLNEYTRTISDRPHWMEPDYATKYRSLLNEVRSTEFHVHRRSHIQESGNRVTCWPSSENWGYDGGFYSRHVSAVELDWLGLPRFQDTLQSQDEIAENLFCEKFKNLLPFYYKNSSWYAEIVKLDEKFLLGCEPGFRRTFRDGLLTKVETMECFQPSPYALLQTDTTGMSLLYLERPQWKADRLLEYGTWKWESVGKIDNAFTMAERIEAIQSSGGKTITGEKLEDFLGCWYGKFRENCAWFRGRGYEDRNW